MPSFNRADKDENDLLQGVIKLFHDRLVKHGVSVELWFAHKNKDDEVAVKVHGRPAHAYARIVPYKERRHSRPPHKEVPDAEIMVDRATWDSCTDKERAALLDHEAAHLLPAIDKQGNLKTDRLGRPRLVMRPHDVEIGHFYDVAERHGEHSFEVRQCREMASRIAAKSKQLQFAFEDTWRLISENGLPPDDVYRDEEDSFPEHAEDPEETSAVA